MNRNRIIKKRIISIITICAMVFSILAFLPSAKSDAIYGASKNKQTTNFANVVLFAHFQGDTEGKDFFADQTNRDAIMKIYDGDHGRSFTNYMKTISYDQFQVHNIFPQDTGTSIESVELPITEEQASADICDTTIIDAVIKEVPALKNKTIDYDNDGYIDNLTIILRGGSLPSERSSSLTSHKSDYPGEATWSNKDIGAYNMLNTYFLIEHSTLPQSSGVVAHEFLHTLGYPDLYTETGESYPVYVWDIMGHASQYLQYPLAYLRMHFTDWIDIETVTSDTSGLTLHTQDNAKGNQAYIIQSPLNEHEVFVVEFRKKATGASYVDEDTIDSRIGGSGLIVYRVDTTVTQLSNHYGETGIYVFRPQSGQMGYDANDSICVQRAFLSKESGRTSIGSADLSKGLTDGALTYSDGSNSGIIISNVSSAEGDSMTFDVTIPDAGAIDTWNNTGFADNGSGNKNVALAADGNTQYMIGCADGKFSLHQYNGTAWTQLGASPAFSEADTPTTMSLFFHNGTLYLGYDRMAKSEFVLKKYNASAKTWTEVTTISDVVYGFDTRTIGGELYIATAGSASAKLHKLESDKFTSLGTYFDDYCGQPRIADINGTIYVSVRDASETNIIQVYQYASSAFTKVSNDTIMNSYTYDMEVLDNKLYISAADPSTKKLKMYSYDGANWDSGNTSDIDYFSPVLVNSQGNLYVLVSPSDGDGYTQVYSYDAEAKEFTLEGINVDSEANNLHLTSSDSNLYVCYVLNPDGSNVIRMKSKKTTNELLSLTITPPTKTAYLKGDTVSTEGLEVKANYVKGSKVLEEGSYEISGFDTGKTGTRTATVSYGGKEGSFVFEIHRNPDDPTIDIEETQINIDKTNFAYTGKEINPVPMIKYNNNTLVNGIDYLLSYSNNRNCGTATITITGIGYYSGTTVQNFTIKKYNHNGWKNIDGNWYYFRNDIAVTGWLLSGGKWYYLDKHGLMLTGLQTIGGQKYYLNSSGAMITGWVMSDGHWYYFTSSGDAAKGWLHLGAWYYFDTDGKMLTGHHTIGGQRYYLTNSGAMHTGWLNVEGTWYYYTDNGASKSWLKVGGIWYYFDNDYKMLTGLQSIGGQKYYFDRNGAMKTGWQRIDTIWYYFSNSGSAVKGWLQLSGVWYYLDNQGRMLTGEQNINGKTYVFDYSGKWIK